MKLVYLRGDERHKASVRVSRRVGHLTDFKIPLIFRYEHDRGKKEISALLGLIDYESTAARLALPLALPVPLRRRQSGSPEGGGRLTGPRPIARFDGHRVSPGHATGVLIAVAVVAISALPVAARDLGTVTTVQVPVNEKARLALLGDVDGDGSDDLVLASSVNDKASDSSRPRAPAAQGRRRVRSRSGARASSHARHGRDRACRRAPRSGERDPALLLACGSGVIV